ncbi:MAG: hypothetical protein ABI947_29140 [Chloroflexota bacterium]
MFKNLSDRAMMLLALSPLILFIVGGVALVIVPRLLSTASPTATIQTPASSVSPEPPTATSIAAATEPAKQLPTNAPILTSPASTRPVPPTPTTKPLQLTF